MNLLVRCVTILVVCNTLQLNAEKLIVVIPSRQVRRSPSALISGAPNLTQQQQPQKDQLNPQPHVQHIPPYLKFAPLYGPPRPAIGLPPNNQLPQAAGGAEQSQNVINQVIPPYTKGFYYPRGYYPFDKYKGLVPFYNQNKYPAEAIIRPRLPGPLYGSIPPASLYHQRPVGSDPYLINKYPAIKSVDQRGPQSFLNHQQPAGGSESLPSTAPIAQRLPAGVPPGFSKLGPIVVKGSGGVQPGATRNGDLLKEGSNAVSKVPPSPAIGLNKGPVVLRDALFLDDYEKQIAEFTKSWPKLSSFPSALSSASSFYPDAGSSFLESFNSANARSSFNLDSSNFIGRQGYEVKEDIDEPPIDFRRMPIITSPTHTYPQLLKGSKAASLYKTIFD